MRKAIFLIWILAIILPVAAQEPADTILDTILANEDLSTLFTAIVAADLIDLLSGDELFTILAPTNDAFSEMLATLNLSEEEFLTNTDLITDILRYHIINGLATTDILTALDGLSITTLQGADINIRATEDTITLNDTATIIATDIEAANGFIHLIDAALLPPDEDDNVEMTGDATATIFEIAANNEDFSMLVAAAEATGLVDTLNGDEPLTIFAPTNAAFEITAKALGLSPQSLLNNTKFMEGVLLYHIIDDILDEEMLRALGGGPIPSREGTDINIRVADGKILINNAVNVITTDIQAANGVIHVIDFALIPSFDASILASIIKDEEEAIVGEDDEDEENVVDTNITEETPTTTTASDEDVVSGADANASEPESNASPDSDPVASTATELIPETIFDVIQLNADFSIFGEVLEAANLVDLIDSDQTFTIFVPTNNAFGNLLETLGVTINELLTNQEVLREVTLYHVIDGTVTRDALRARAGDSIITAQGSAINIDIINNALTLNNSIQVIAADAMLANGTMHIIDGVLSPFVARTIARDETGTANFRVAHFSTDTPPLDVYINDERSILRELTFQDITGWIPVPSGSYELALVPAGDIIENAVIGPLTVSLASDTWTTLVAHGNLETGSLSSSVISEDFSEIDANSARITAFHAIEDAPLVDIRVNGVKLIDFLGYPNSFRYSGGSLNDGIDIQDIAAGTYQLSVTPATSPAIPLITISDLAIEADRHYFIALVGTPDNPQLRLAITE